MAGPLAVWARDRERNSSDHDVPKTSTSGPEPVTMPTVWPSVTSVPPARNTASSAWWCPGRDSGGAYGDAGSLLSVTCVLRTRVGWEHTSGPDGAGRRPQGRAGELRDVGPFRQGADRTGPGLVPRWSRRR